MIKIKFNKIVFGLIIVLLFLSQCSTNCDDQQMLKLLSKQNLEYLLPFIDTLKLDADPQKYNPNYACIGLEQLSPHAPNVLEQYWYFWKTHTVDTVGYVCFDSFYQLEGIPKHEALIVTYENRERAYFRLLTFEEEGIETGQAFLVLENELDDGSYCLEFDQRSIRFKGEVRKDSTKIEASYIYRAHCKTVKDKKVKSIFWVDR